MRISNKKLKQLCNAKTVSPCEEAKVYETIQKAKSAYYASEAESPLSRWEFIFQQGKFIKKQWWLLQALLLLGLWLILKYSESSYHIQRSIALLAPLFVVLIIPEIWKNRTADAMEVECTTRFSLRQVYSARMILFGIVDLFLLTAFFIASSALGKLTVQELVIQFFIPFNVTGCICFRTLYSKRVGSEAYSLLLCFLWIALWSQVVLNETIYQTVSVPVWAALLALSAGYSGYWIYRGQKQDSRMWEVKPQWN